MFAILPSVLHMIVCHHLNLAAPFVYNQSVREPLTIKGNTVTELIFAVLTCISTPANCVNGPPTTSIPANCAWTAVLPSRQKFLGTWRLPQIMMFVFGLYCWWTQSNLTKIRVNILQPKILSFTLFWPNIFWPKKNLFPALCEVGVSKLASKIYHYLIFWLSSYYPENKQYPAPQ